MSGQWEYSLGIYKAGLEVLLPGHWLEPLALLMFQGSRGALREAGKAVGGAGGEERCEMWVCSASKVLSSETQS